MQPGGGAATRPASPAHPLIACPLTAHAPPPPYSCPLQQMASDSLVGNRTLGGRQPVVVHFTRHKPFRGPQPGRPGHQFLCSLEEVEGE